MIEKMLSQRKQVPKNNNITTHTRTQKNKVLNNNVSKIQKLQKTIRNDNGQTVRIARENSFRRCGNCDFFVSKQKRCGLFYRKVSSNNVCSRFHYTKYRTYLGGGFSPR